MLKMSVQASDDETGKVEIVLFTYKWVINNFSVSCSKDVGEKIKSPLFTIETDKELKWRLHLYPKGVSQENKDFLSLYLKLESEKCVRARFVFYVFDKYNKKTAVYDPRGLLCFSSTCSRGTARFMETCMVSDGSTKNVLINDKLTIFCDITVDFESSKTIRNHNVNSIQELHFSRLAELDKLEELLDNEKFSDVTLNIEGKEFHAHKNILASKSAVFAAMFEHDMKENTDNEVEIKEIKYEVFKELLRFIYAGKVNDIDNVADGLFAAADKYQLERLKVMCEETMIENLSNQKAVEYLKLADLYDVHKLKKKAVDFIVLNLNDMLDNPDFKSIGELHPDVIYEVFRALALEKHTES